MKPAQNPVMVGSTSPARQFYQMTKPSLMHHLFLRDLPSPSYHSSSYSPTGPNITQWSELVSNFQPETPQLFNQNGENVNSGLLQHNLDQLAKFESDLANIRKEKHSKWLSDIFRKERFHSSTKEGQEFMEQTVIDSELLTRMVRNTDNLLESLDFKFILFSVEKSD